MAFGSWIKKIGEKVKSFGAKVRDRVVPIVEKGLEYAQKAAPLIEKFGEKTGIQGIENFGRTVGKVAETANGWIRKGKENLQQLTDS